MLNSIGLKDRFGNEITNGCEVEVIATINKTSKGNKMTCVWNIPNHRWAFVYSEAPFKNPSTNSSEPFYATPRIVNNLKVLVK